MDLNEAVKSITYLKNNTAQVVREAAESGRPLVVTQNGEAKAVVMGGGSVHRMETRPGAAKAAGPRRSRHFSEPSRGPSQGLPPRRDVCPKGAGG